MSNKISIAMCTYNGARYLRQQLASIATQTRLPDELVVVDDCSQDESVNIVRDFAASVAFPIQLHVNKTNLGSTGSFEYAISRCSGDIIALCDQDDIWLAEKLARLATAFADDVGLVFSDAEVVDETGQPTGKSLWERVGLNEPERLQLERGEGFDSLLQGATVTGAASAFRSRLRPLVLPLPRDLPLIHDAWIAMLAGAVSKIVPLPECLLQYRQHTAQQVGPLARKRPEPSNESIHEALQRQNPYAEMLAISTAVQHRLMDKRDDFDSAEALTQLDAKITHLEARSQMPKAGPKRVARVFRELVTGRYHRFSSGLVSAVKDLFA